MAAKTGSMRGRAERAAKAKNKAKPAIKKDAWNRGPGVWATVLKHTIYKHWGQDWVWGWGYGLGLELECGWV